MVTTNSPIRDYPLAKGSVVALLKPMKTITKNAQGKLPKTAQEFLRRDAGAQARIARRLDVNRSTVCRVLAGKKTSRRVRMAILREIERLARLYGATTVLAELKAARREQVTTGDLRAQARWR